jgi:hypothetical protein
MHDYSELKSELPQMLEIVEKFPDQLQERVLDILVAEFLGTESAGSVPCAPRENIEVPAVVLPKEPRSHHRTSRDTVNIVPNLNLRPSGQLSLVDFVKEKNPKSCQEFNAVAVYYLARKLLTEAITSDCVYTCYKEAGRRPPDAFLQNLRNTEKRKAWIDVSDLKHIRLTQRGETLVDHDLPRTSANDASRQKTT